MMHKAELLKKLFPIEELKKSGLKILAIIINRTDGERAERFLRERHFHIQYSCMAEGTLGSDILDMFGFGSIDKTVLLCVAPGFRINIALPEIVYGLSLNKPGKGIIFTIPLIGVGIPDIPSPRIAFAKGLLKDMENEVDKMNHEITHSIILAIINQGFSEELVEAAKLVGAKGGTILNARRTGTEDAVSFFGLNVQSEKEIVAILTHREQKQAIMDELNHSYGIVSPAHGIIVSIPVDGVVGLED